LARLQQAQAGKEKGSRRRKRSQRRKYAMLDKTAQRIGRVPAQPVTTACTRRIINHLNSKTAGAIPLRKPLPRRRVPSAGSAGSGARVAGCIAARRVGPLPRVTRWARSISWRSACMTPCSQVVTYCGRSRICAPGLAREASRAGGPVDTRRVARPTSREALGFRP
jgi:hypothetical protein